MYVTSSLTLTIPVGWKKRVKISKIILNIGIMFNAKKLYLAKSIGHILFIYKEPGVLPIIQGSIIPSVKR